tara:strand:+ start:108 stop:932 length:825 start_codon:yes stop_codon:yes gene_type:complete
MPLIHFKNLKKGFKKPHRIIPSLLYRFNNKEENIRQKICNKNIIWHFCTPKSASSYLVYLMMNLDINTIVSMPHYGNRPHVNDFSDLLEKIKTYPFNNFFYISHQHTLFDDYLERFISKKHKVIIQTRNIYESILSLQDMLILKKKNRNNPWVQFSKKYSKEEFLKLLIYNYVPFHCNFIKSWVENEIKGEKIFVNYKDYVKNEKKYLKKILFGNKKNIIIPKLKTIDKKTIKFHIGLKRKNTLSAVNKKLIDDIVNINTKYSYPKVKSLIYQN